MGLNTNISFFRKTRTEKKNRIVCLLIWDQKQTALYFISNYKKRVFFNTILKLTIEKMFSKVCFTVFSPLNYKKCSGWTLFFAH